MSKTELAVGCGGDRNADQDQESVLAHHRFGGTRMKVKQIFVIAIWLTALTSLAVAQGKLKINPEDRYLLLSTIKTSTMQKELDEAAAQGFRVIASSSSCGQNEAVLFL